MKYVVADGSGGVTTDVNGNYELKLSAGTHNIAVSYIGYKTQTIPLTIIANETQIKDVLLDEDIKELGTVVISAGKIRTEIRGCYSFYGCNKTSAD